MEEKRDKKEERERGIGDRGGGGEGGGLEEDKRTDRDDQNRQ